MQEVARAHQGTKPEGHSPQLTAPEPEGGQEAAAGGQEQEPAAPEAQGGAAPAGAAAPKGAQIRQARKDLQKLERELERLNAREQELHLAMAASATDHEQLGTLSAELETLLVQREQAESSWLETASLLEG